MNLASNLAVKLGFRSQFAPQDNLPSGLAPLDRLIQGLPRGGISEIVGPESSGRATLAHALLASSTARQEVCAYIDTADGLDPHSAAAAGVALEKLIWIRCGHNVESAFKATDLILHAGGFGVVVFDLSRVTDRALRSIPISYWYRFRRAVEDTPTILALIEREAQAKSCASMILELKRKKAVWAGAPGFHLLREVEIEAGCRKPVRPVTASFPVQAMA